MLIEHNFQLTPAANASAAALGKTSLQLHVPAEFPAMQCGDLFSTEALMPLVLVITRRHFHFVGPDHIQIDYLLDRQPEQ